MTYDTDMIAANAIAHAASQASYAIQCAADQYTRPSVIYRPALRIDGNQWCALYGANLQEGIAGFGDSPADAMYAFDKAWITKLAAEREGP